MTKAEFRTTLAEIWDSSEYYNMMVARKKIEKRRIFAAVTTVIVAVLVISITIFAANSRKTDILFTYYGFEQSVIKVNGKYYLFYTGDKSPLYGEYNGNKYYLGAYKSCDFEKVDNFIAERDNAYKKVVEEYGDYSYTVETDEATITYFNDAEVIKAKIAEKLSDDSLKLIAANENAVEGTSLLGNVLTLYVLEESGGDVLFIPAQYPSDVRFFVAADKVNEEIEGKGGEAFYRGVLSGS